MRQTREMTSEVKVAGNPCVFSRRDGPQDSPAGTELPRSCRRPWRGRVPGRRRLACLCSPLVGRSKIRFPPLDLHVDSVWRVGPLLLRSVLQAPPPRGRGACGASALWAGAPFCLCGWVTERGARALSRLELEVCAVTMKLQTCLSSRSWSQGRPGTRGRKGGGRRGHVGPAALTTHRGCQDMGRRAERGFPDLTFQANDRAE